MDKIPVKAIEKYRYGLRKTVSKHLNFNFMQNSFTYKCAQLLNKLPEDVKLADNVNIFESKLRSIQL